MTDRKRLIRLLEEIDKHPDITCPNPKSAGACRSCKHNINNFLCNSISREADYLLEHGVIVLPCKVGDTVYFLDYDTSSCNNCELFSGGYCGRDSFCTKHYSLYPEPCEEDEEVCPKHKLIVKPTRFSVFFSHRQKDFGKTVFLSREEAEKALKERANNV